MKSKVLCALLWMSIFSFECCLAERYIRPTKYDYQKEILVQGASVISSQKDESLVLMYQTSKTIKNNRGNFYFIINNKSCDALNFYFNNLKVTDQFGRYVKVVHKKELISNKNNKKNWQLFMSALATGAESTRAQDAGRIDYQSNTNVHYNSNVKVFGSNGWATGSSVGNANIATKGSIHCEALRQQAMRQVQADADYRNDIIQANYDFDEYKLNNFYFDSTTIFPDAEYASNFQIEVPCDIENELEYLLFKFEVGNDIHTFCFFCGKEVKKWYHLLG